MGARARSTREHAFVSAQVRAALTAAAGPAHLEELDGAGLLSARPWLLDAPAELVAREAWRCFGPERSDGRCTLAQAEQLIRACRQLERVGYGGLSGPAASRAAAIDLALGDHAEFRPSGWSTPPRTLGGLAVCLRRLARGRVSSARARRRRATAAADG